MRILVIQFVPAVRGRPAPRFEPQLGVLLSLLKERGHELALLGLARFDEPQIKAALARALPQLIYADVSSVCVDIARRTLQYVHEREFLPIVAGGAFAAADPAACLSLPGVQAVAVGEPDASLVTHLERSKDPAAGQIVQGVWMRDERGLVRPDVPALVEELDSLPLPERELFGYADWVQRTGEIEVAVGRGCPQGCSYCRNPRMANLYTDRGQWTRRRPPEHVLEEIAALRREYPAARIVRFLDHAFALDGEWLEELLGLYARETPLPYRCHLRANAAAEPDIRRLADTGCKLADVEVVSGSNFIRNEVFAMDLDERQIVATFDALRAAGIRSRAVVYLGAPYESEASLDGTRKLLARIRPDVLDARPYYPFPGTAAAELCREQGWQHSKGEWQYHNDRCGLDMPACRAAHVEAFLRRLRNEFPASLNESWWRRWSAASRTTLAQFFQKKRRVGE